MNAFRALGRGIVPEAESAWLFKIAENVCLSRRRSSWRRGRIESPSDFEIIEEIIPGPSRQNDELIGIEDALASMPEQQRRAILLREWQGLSYREIAEELEVTQSAVETLIFRARRSLAAGLEQPDSVKKPKRKSLPPRSACARHRHGRRRVQGAARREARPSRQQLLPSRSRRPPVPPTASKRRSSRSHRSGQPHRRRRWSASLHQPLRPLRRSRRPSGQLGSPQLPHRSVRPSQPRRSARAPSRSAAAVVKHSAPLHYIPAAVTPVQASPAAQTPAAAEPASDQVSAPAAGAAEHRRGQERQRHAQRRAGTRRTRRSRADRGARARIADEGRAVRRHAHDDDLPDPRACGRHEPGSGSCDRGSGSSDSGRDDAEHEDGRARARLRHELAAARRTDRPGRRQGPEAARTAVPRTRPTAPSRRGTPRR